MRLSRTIAPVAALVFVTASTAAGEPATDKSAKSKSETTATATKSAQAKPKHHAKSAHLKKPLPPLPKSEKSDVKEASAKDVKDASADHDAHHAKAKGEAKKPSDGKDAKKVDPTEPPPELTGSLPQAKLATKKTDAKKDDVAKIKDDKATKKHPTTKDKKVEKPTTTKPAKTGGLTPIDAPKLGMGKKGPNLKSCLHPSVSFARLGQPNDVVFPLTTCKGSAAPGAIENLSVLARPYTVPAAPLMPLSVLSLPGKAKPSKAFKKPSDEIAPGIKRIDPGLITRLQSVADHFPGKTITLVSGFRPNSKGSPHSSARAFDIRIDGVTNESLVTFCKTLKDTGCGYYPNSYFVHIDVRPEGAGHVYWIDTSGPGEKPNYVKSWPPPLPPAKKSDEAKVEAAKKGTLDADAKALDDMAKDVAPTTDESKIGTMDEGGTSHSTDDN